MDINLESDIRCHRCDGQLILLARVPHALHHSDGCRVEGHRTTGLCATCDRDNPNAQGVLAFFSRYETVTTTNSDTFALLIQEWMRRETDRPPPEDFDQQTYEDYLRWRSGDL